jgi:hypothetical protein
MILVKQHYLASLREKANADNDCHHATIVVGQDLGLTLELRPDGSGAEYLQNYCLLKKYQLKVPRWMYISVAADFRPNACDRAMIFSGEWRFDAQMEAALQKFREHKLGPTKGVMDTCEGFTMEEEGGLSE